MRDRTEIEREMFHARQDLEENLGRLLHRARERLALPARARHAIGESARAHPALITITGIMIACVIASVILWRLRR